MDNTLREEANLDEHRLFTRLLNHLKPCIAVETHKALKSHLENLGVVAIGSDRVRSNSKITEIVDCLWERGIVIVSGRGNSKKHYL